MPELEEPPASFKSVVWNNWRHLGYGENGERDKDCVSALLHRRGVCELTHIERANSTT